MLGYAWLVKYHKMDVARAGNYHVAHAKLIYAVVNQKRAISRHVNVNFVVVVNVRAVKQRIVGKGKTLFVGVVKRYVG